MPLSKEEYERAMKMEPGTMTPELYAKLTSLPGGEQSRPAEAYEGVGFKPKRGEAKPTFESGMSVAKQTRVVNPLGAEGTPAAGGANSTTINVGDTLDDERERAAKHAWFKANPTPEMLAAKAAATAPAYGAPVYDADPRSNAGMSAYKDPMQTMVSFTPNTTSNLNPQPTQAHTMGGTLAAPPAELTPELVAGMAKKGAGAPAGLVALAEDLKKKKAAKK